MDLSFSLSQLLHFHSTASLQSGQYSDADISFPHARQSILYVVLYLFCTFLTIIIVFYVKLVRVCCSLTSIKFEGGLYIFAFACAGQFCDSRKP